MHGLLDPPMYCKDDTASDNTVYVRGDKRENIIDNLVYMKGGGRGGGNNNISDNTVHLRERGDNTSDNTVYARGGGVEETTNDYISFMRDSKRYLFWFGKVCSECVSQLLLKYRPT